MNIKLSKTDYFFIFSVLFLFLLTNILCIQEPLSKKKKKKLKRKERKGRLTPAQEAKLSAYREKKVAQRDEQQATRDENVSDRKEAAANTVKQRMEDETAYVKLKDKIQTKVNSDLFDYRKRSEDQERKARFDQMGRLYPHATAQMIMFKPKFKMADPHQYARHLEFWGPGGWPEEGRIRDAAFGKWGSVNKFNSKIEYNRRQNKLPTDESDDWRIGKVDNTQKLIDLGPYAGKHKGNITIDGVEDTTYNDRLRGNDDVELKEQVVTKYMANRPLAKTIWDDVVDQFPMDVRDWEREEPGAFDPTLYMSKKQRKKARKVEKKQEKKDKIQEKAKRKKEEEDAERRRRSAPKDDPFIKFWKDLFNIKN